MYFTNFIKVAPFAMVLAFNSQMGCGTSSQTDTNTPSNPSAPIGQQIGHLDLEAAKLVSQDYLAVNLNIKTIEVLDVNGNWISVCAPNRIINILDQASVSALLAANVDLAVGLYTKARLTLGDGSTIQLKDGTSVDLNLSAELKAGLVLDINLNVDVDAKIKAVLDLDLDACIQVVVAGGVNTYYLRPLFRILDKAHLGTITGIVKARATGAVQAGVKVWAEYFDDLGRPHIELSAVTDVDGRFTLDRLTLGRKYHVVCRPIGIGVALDAAASVELDLGAAVNLTTELDLDAAVVATASASGNITPRVDLTAADRVQLVEFLGCGPSCNKWFIVDDAQAKVDVNENYRFDINSMGRFAVQCARQLCGTGGVCNWLSLWVGADLNVTASANLTLDIALKL
jgi:hypothetical protein